MYRIVGRKTIGIHSSFFTRVIKLSSIVMISRVFAIILFLCLFAPYPIKSVILHHEALYSTSKFSVCTNTCGEEFSMCSISSCDLGETIYCWIRHKNCSEQCYDQRLIRIRKKLRKCRRNKGKIGEKQDVQVQ